MPDNKSSASDELAQRAEDAHVDARRLAEIEARASAAALPPWTAGANDKHRIFKWGYSTVLGFSPRVLFDANQHFDDFRANVVFAAGARQDVPDLCGEVRRLRHALECCRSYFDVLDTVRALEGPDERFVKKARLHAGIAKYEVIAALSGLTVQEVFDRRARIGTED